jgi:hypothetical protein
MYYKIDNNTIAIKLTGGTESWEIPLDGFTVISSMRLSPDGDRLALTGVAKGDATPSLKSNDKGDIRLYLYERTAATWQRISKRYAHDAVFIPGTDSIAFHNGNGITIITSAGQVQQETHQGQFNWGPPSLSISPTSKYVTWVRWKGDDRKLNTMEIATGAVKDFAPSFYRYAWKNDHTVWIENGSALKELDFTTGKTTTLIRSLQQAFIKGKVDTTDAQLLELFACPAEDQDTSYGELAAHCGALYFWAQHLCWKNRERKLLTIRVGSSRELTSAKALFRLSQSDNRAVQVQHIADNEYITNIGIHPDGTIGLSIEANRGTSKARDISRAFGPQQQLIESGWSIFTSNHTPLFGFHWIGE